MMSIHTKKLAVMRDLGTIVKTTVGEGRYSYEAFTVDTVYDTVRELFVQHGITITPERPKVEYERHETDSGKIATTAHYSKSLTLTDAETDTQDVICFEATARDLSDKAPIQAGQQALKYALVQTFLVSAGEPNPEEPAEPVKKRKGPKDWENEAKILVWETVNEDKDEAAKWFKTALAATEVGKVTTKAGMEKVVRWVQSEFVGVGAAGEAHGDGPQPPDSQPKESLQ
jgi:hypothetical protein